MESIKGILSSTFRFKPSTPNFVFNSKIEENEVFKRFIISKSSYDYIEIPVINSSRDIDDRNRSIYTLPLINENFVVKVASFKGILGESIRCTNTLSKIQIKNAIIYYVGKGIIFDENFNLLFLCVHNFILTEYDTQENCKYTNKCYINPILFSKKDFISKNIIKVIIPLLGEVKIPVILTSIDDFITIPTPPYKIEAIKDDIPKFLDKDINTFISIHKEELLLQIIHNQDFI
jgi:hypothetical protein